jgi:wyosine [tRNA(Phe)-imidazoG37] synthetase (radical SAM superfamily)
VPADKLLGELASWLFNPHPQFEVITLGGMGEPTLNSDMGRIIEGVRELAPDMPVAVLTNSSLMDDPQVRTELALADMVLPSMDTLVPAEFAALNKPLAGSSLVDIRRGLLEFRKLYPGKIYLEILVLADVNDSDENLERLRAFVDELSPDRVDVVTMTRPGAYPQALPAPPVTLERFRNALCRGEKNAHDEAEKARHFGHTLDNPTQERLQALSIRVLDSLTRRPQTANGLALALGEHVEPVQNLLDDLAARGLVTPTRLSGETFYLRGGK